MKEIIEKISWLRHSSDIEHRLEWFLFIRLSVLFAALGSVVLLHLLAGWTQPATVAAYAILTTSFFFTLVSAIGIHAIPSGMITESIQVLFDAVVTGVWLRFLGAEVGAPSLFFIVQILAAALAFQKQGAWIATCASMLIYAATAGATAGIMTVATHWILFWVIGATGGYLSEELARTTRSLASKEVTIERLAKLHDRILKALPTGLVTVDRELRVNFANPEALHMLGLDGTPVVGRTLQTVAPMLLPFFDKIENQIMAKEKAQWQVETLGLFHRSAFVRDRLGNRRLQQRVEDGKRVWRGDVAQIGSAIEGSGLLQSDATEGRILLFQDVTAVDHLEERLRQHEKLAAVGQLAAGIAHEIRNPLASMSASIEMLIQSAQTSGEDKKLMEITIREIDRLNGLITEFLDYVRPDKIKVVPFSIKGLVDEVIASVRRRKDFPRDATLSSKIAQDWEFLGHREKLSQVLLNLVINAMQAITPKGQIEVGAKQELDFDVIWVLDNGIGMKESVKVHLFEPFFTTKQKGTGLGLAIAYRIIEAHGGTFEVTSEEGRGSKFELKFPRETR